MFQTAVAKIAVHGKTNRAALNHVKAKRIADNLHYRRRLFFFLEPLANHSAAAYTVFPKAAKQEKGFIYTLHRRLK